MSRGAEAPYGRGGRLVVSQSEVFPDFLENAHDDEGGEERRGHGVDPDRNGERFGDHVEFELIHDLDASLPAEGAEEGDAAQGSDSL